MTHLSDKLREIMSFTKLDIFIFAQITRCSLHSRHDIRQDSISCHFIILEIRTTDCMSDRIQRIDLDLEVLTVYKRLDELFEDFKRPFFFEEFIVHILKDEGKGMTSVPSSFEGSSAAVLAKLIERFFNYLLLSV